MNHVSGDVALALLDQMQSDTSTNQQKQYLAALGLPHCLILHVHTVSSSDSALKDVKGMRKIPVVVATVANELNNPFLLQVRTIDF